MLIYLVILMATLQMINVCSLVKVFYKNEFTVLWRLSVYMYTDINYRTLLEKQQAPRFSMSFPGIFVVYIFMVELRTVRIVYCGCYVSIVNTSTTIGSTKLPTENFVTVFESKIWSYVFLRFKYIQVISPFILS